MLERLVQRDDIRTDHLHVEQVDPVWHLRPVGDTLLGTSRRGSAGTRGRRSSSRSSSASPSRRWSSGGVSPGPSPRPPPPSPPPGGSTTSSWPPSPPSFARETHSPR